MKNLAFFVFFSYNFFAQENVSFRTKKELFCGINYDVRFDTTFFGVKTGYSMHFGESKRTYYRIEMQYHKQYFNRTYGNSKYPAFYYEDLTVNRITLNNIFSWRFYQKHKDHLYFELGIYLGVDLWQEKKGDFFEFTGPYQYKKEEIKKKSYLMPNNTGINLAWGIRVGRKILLKPELRLSLHTFDKIYVGDESRSLNAVLLATFNLSYLF